MGAIVNGLAAHGGFIPYGATFLIFSDYMRPPIRLAALMGLRVVHVFTHDSIALGEDGPTHQPVEQLASLRAIPHLDVIRPADANETAVAWRVAIETRDRPVLLALTRQDVPRSTASRYAAPRVCAAARTCLRDAPNGRPTLILIASGSEVGLIVAAPSMLRRSIAVRCVSMPSWELFEAQPQAIATRCCRPTIGARSRSKSACRKAGIATSASAARCSAWAYSRSSTGFGTDAQVICGLDHVAAVAEAQPGPYVVNMSLGDPNRAGETTCDASALHQAICNLTSSGVTVVAAAGNDGTDAASFVPAAYDEVIAVSAFTDFDGQAQLCRLPDGLLRLRLPVRRQPRRLQQLRLGRRRRGARRAHPVRLDRRRADARSAARAWPRLTSPAPPRSCWAPTRACTPAQVRAVLESTGECPDGSVANAPTCAGHGQWQVGGLFGDPPTRTGSPSRSSTRSAPRRPPVRTPPPPPPRRLPHRRLLHPRMTPSLPP